MYEKVYFSDGSLNTTLIKRVVDNAYIPLEDGNVDYRAYLAWVANGNEASEPS